ncbi:hypothetical protein ACET3Z_024936 [Daucus carota]
MDITSFSSLLVCSLIIISALVATIIINTKFPRKGHKNLPPGSYGWPFVGETLALLQAGWNGTPEKFIRERVEKHGDVFKTCLLGDSIVVFSGVAGNKFLFGNEGKTVALWWPKSVNKLFENCLITSSGEEAKWTRKMLHSFLSPDAFSRLYINIMDQVTQKHISTHWQGKQEVKVYHTIKFYTFELACRLFMSLEDPDHIKKLAYHFNIFLKGIIQIPLNVPGTRFYNAMRAVNAIRKDLHVITRQRRVDLEQKTASPSQDLLSHLLVSSDEHGRFLTEAEIVNNILTLLFAGHDTSSVSITLVMKTLAEKPHVYQKIYDEHMEIAAAKGHAELLQWDDIQKMKYTWNVVSEVMRITPPVIGAFREALVDFTYAGYTIPKGWKLYWSTVSTSKDERYFPDPTEFDASRFDGAGPTPYSYVPFGGGPRMCLGKEFARMEILVFLHNVVKKFKWDLLIADEKIEYDPMPTPVKGLPISLHPHNV